MGEPQVCQSRSVVHIPPRIDCCYLYSNIIRIIRIVNAKTSPHPPLAVGPEQLIDRGRFNLLKYVLKFFRGDDSMTGIHPPLDETSDMAENIPRSDKPFPLKRYYLIYAGIGGLIFYVILFVLFIRAERQALYDQYVHHLSQKADALYQDVNRDFLTPRNLSLADIKPDDLDTAQGLREEIDGLIKTDPHLVKVKLFTRTGTVLYDHLDRSAEGKRYASFQEDSFTRALTGVPSAKIEKEADGRRFMEVYLPLHTEDTGKIEGVIELYEEVSRFEKMVFQALKQALVLPTIIFIVFNLLLFLIVAKADRIITRHTQLLTRIRRNMERYISPSAAAAIYEAVTANKDLFRGERQHVVVFFSDIRGFTAYSETNSPERVVMDLNTIFEIQAAIIHHHGGTIDKFVGDEVMAVFPGDRPEDAVQAALDIIGRLDSRADTPFRIGIGIHSGEAVVGSIGTKKRRDYTVIGNTVNTGARLCGAGAPGQIFISADVYNDIDDNLRGAFPFKTALALKGKARPFDVYSNQ